MYIDYTPAEKRAEGRAARLLRRSSSPTSCSTRSAGTRGRRAALHARRSGGWAPTAGSASAGRRSSAARARSAIEQYIFFDEVQRAGFPIPFLTLCTVGPTLMKYGTDEQKAKLLPAILRGELHFAIGYSRAERRHRPRRRCATRAVRDGDDYVVNGQKVFTSLAEYADYIWLAVRTDPGRAQAQGHLHPDGATPRRPGFSLTPDPHARRQPHQRHLLRRRARPASMRVGRENEGWRLITTQLNHERVALMSPGPVDALRRGDRRPGPARRGGPTAGA